MKQIQWIEEAKLRPGLRTNDRELINKLANEIYKLHDLNDVAISHNSVDSSVKEENEWLKKQLTQALEQLDHVRGQLKFQEASVEVEAPKKKRKLF